MNGLEESYDLKFKNIPFNLSAMVEGDEGLYKVKFGHCILLVISFLNWAIPGLLFLYYSILDTVFNTVDYWIWTTDLWCQREPQSQPNISNFIGFAIL